MEAGIEPCDDFDATSESLCDCENCQECRAANALRLDCFKSHFLASLDADLHWVIEQWPSLRESVRNTILAVIGNHFS